MVLGQGPSIEPNIVPRRSHCSVGLAVGVRVGRGGVVGGPRDVMLS